MKHGWRLSLGLLAILLVGSSSARAALDPSIVARTQRLVGTAIETLAHPTFATGQHFDNGVWHSPHDQGLWDYQVGPGAAAAVLWRSTGETNGRLLRIAESTFDQAIAQHRLHDGSFGPGPDAGPASQSPDIATIWFGSELGTTYLELAPRLGPARLKRWRSALSGAADFLIPRDLDWYINGNDNLGEAEVYYLAWRITGQARYQRAYNADWSFTLSPPQDRWAGFGLRSVPGARRDVLGHQVEGPAAYLAESNPGAPGFDPYYTVTQLDALARLYVLSGDPRALTIADELVNNELSRVNASWYLNTSRGSRHQQANTYVPFLTPALVVLSGIGGRSDLGSLARSQFELIDQHYGDTAGYYPPDYMGLSDEVALILQAARRSPRSR